MGLDMYLEGSIYLGGAYHNMIPKRVKLCVSETFKLCSGKDSFNKVKIYPTDNLEELVYRIGYWRKANQIHKWFVDNVQEGHDDCKKYDVLANDLKQLKSLCIKLLKTKDKEKAIELLPPYDGFFFGDTNTDNDSFWEYYWEELKETVRIMNRALRFMKNYNADITYQSSW